MSAGLPIAMERIYTKIVALDADFKTPCILRKIFLNVRLPAIPYTRPKTKDGFFRKSDYVYANIKADGITCPPP